MKLCKTYVVPYLILTLFLTAGLMLTGCAPLSAEAAPAPESESATSVQPPEQALDAPLNAADYELVTHVYEEADRRIKIAYPQITGFKGELLQDYMNQSLRKPVEVLTDGTTYTDLDVDFKVTLKTQERLSVILTGTGQLEGGREFNYLNSVNLDLKTSNEITFETFIKEDPVSREAFTKLLDQKLKASGYSEGAEYEGLRLFFRPEEVVFFFMPLDDSAEAFVQISVPNVELEGLVKDTFGERPAS
ncbi:hypothetical protein [Acidaminobacter hydrogenoformans]|uniref:DUF3298 domain-containing protein n=1 Tax=Acidaminobacter hydrogenoformans DSM 2784 TaxID=1120920 RepID=A0A1G5RST0_9FIRM|nr:hypothetical protein [Acidaminobacter hydrogenoformans]SCZ76359.1 hypothetical protein SAMN03080599_00197 [Acidaminobacter hydrogenoformans DSM 2784]